MWLADEWMDYEVIDCSKGEKLERWGDYLLVRPDPQVIWDTPRNHKGWKKMNGHYHRSSKGGGEWEFFHLPEQWSIGYKGLTFNLKPFSFKHTGLFPEQAANWDWFGARIRGAQRENPDDRGYHSSSKQTLHGISYKTRAPSGWFMAYVPPRYPLGSMGCLSNPVCIS